jgi:hypothetical protein
MLLEPGNVLRPISILHFSCVLLSELSLLPVSDTLRVFGRTHNVAEIPLSRRNEIQENVSVPTSALENG